jgi:hypothetical protein
MSHRIVVSRSWCQECLRDCFQAYDEATGRWTHIGPETQDFAAFSAELKERGYYARHEQGSVYSFHRLASRPLPIPDDIVQYIEARGDLIDADQDW